MRVTFQKYKNITIEKGPGKNYYIYYCKSRLCFYSGFVFFALLIAKAEYKIILSQIEMFKGTDKIVMYM